MESAVQFTGSDGGQEKGQPVDNYLRVLAVALQRCVTSGRVLYRWFWDNVLSHLTLIGTECLLFCLFFFIYEVGDLWVIWKNLTCYDPRSLFKKGSWWERRRGAGLEGTVLVQLVAG